MPPLSTRNKSSRRRLLSPPSQPALSLALVASIFFGFQVVGVVTPVSSSPSGPIRIAAPGAGVRFNPPADISGPLEGDQGPLEGLSLASSDLDGDGAADLIAGYRGARGGLLKIFRGNIDSIYPEASEAVERRAQGQSSSSPFLLPPAVYALPESPDFLSAGDLDGDGRLEIAAAARGGNGLYIIGHDEQGSFGSPRRIDLPGKVTAMAAGDADLAGGLMTIAVAVSGADGPGVMVFDMLATGSKAFPELIPIAAETSNLSLALIHEDGSSRLVIAAGSSLLVRRPTGVRRPTDRSSAAFHETRSFPFDIVSMATGRFSESGRNDIALLASDGAIHLLSGADAIGRSDLSIDSIKRRSGNIIAHGSWSRGTRIVRANVSGRSTDDLIVVEPGSDHLQALTGDVAGNELAAQFASLLASPVDAGGETVAALAMRLNEDALSDLVVLRKATPVPAVISPAVSMTFIVSNTNDDGPGSLRQAITDANNNPDPDTINFNIPGAGPYTIALESPLPVITSPVTINGASQPGFAGTPVVELNGISAGPAADGLNITAGSSTVRGLVINRFSGNGIVLASNSNIVEGNFIGTNTAGTFALPNSLDGVFISGASNTVGGTTTAARNLISGNRNGVHIFGATATANAVRGNFIGPDFTGTLAIGNSLNGVLIASSSSSNAIGSAAANTANVIAFNGGSGVNVASGVSNAILSNSIFSNSVLGIDLGNNGFTDNDNLDVDTGANTLQNFPVITAASSSGGSTTIQGTLNSTPSTTFRLEFFANLVCGSLGAGEGRTLLGAQSVTTDATGNVGFTATFPVAVTPGQIITATATNPANNTSEFSRCVMVGGVVGGQPADLGVAIVISPSVAQTGSEITKTIVVTNTGPGIATNVTVTDALTSSLSFVSCSSTGGGVCGGTGSTRTVTFATFAPGTTAVITLVARVNCNVAGGGTIGNTVAVFSATTPDPNIGNNLATGTVATLNPEPRITCPANITVTNDPGVCTRVVNFATPIVTDNCPGASIACSPAPGSSFPIGTTTVTCIATDSGGLSATCTFTVTVNDTEPVQIICPPNVTVTAQPGNCRPSVVFPAPRVVDNCPGTSAVCTPASGTTFPIGTTTVTCTAGDGTGGTATCSFTVTVIGTPRAELVIEGGGIELEFGPVSAKGKSRKLKKQPGRNFTIENVGCVPFTLTLESIRRLGNDVDRGRITDPDDQRLFSVNLVDAGGGLTKLEILKHIVVQPGEKVKFRVLFNPVIPAVTSNTRGLAAHQVLPNVINSRITFRLDDGSAITLDLDARISTEVQLIHPDLPKRPPLVSFARVENEFVVQYSIYDSNLDVNRATYQFFDSRGRPVQQELSADLTSLIQSRGFVRGQTFTVTQRFTGASDHPGIVGVRVSVFDGQSSFAASSVPNVNTSSAVTIRSLVGPGPAELLMPVVDLADAFNTGLSPKSVAKKER